ncbi:hypothetical protein DL765_000014 [Monosporascus sp. GIB2]|nr:hypothetical protein DL765_000014 [Monosporascus sp. GIB2]
MDANGQEIAIIGSACRFPGDATSPSKLWDLLRAPRLVASPVPALKGYFHENGQYHGHANVKEAYLLAGEGVNRRFDAAFFGIKPAEANVLDPQIRLLLETVYEALETGGETIENLRGSDTAVYAAQMVNDYELLMYRDLENLGVYHATGTSRAMLSNRISYFFDWHGPSMTIDTACSSSLVALHHAVQQLRSGHSRVAIVAGSNLIYDAGVFIAETNLQMLSPDGRSRMWDADANGYARGEGVAVVVLKTRQVAEVDGDHIECIIRETALGQDGKTLGQTMPSASAQAQLIRDCYARAGLNLTNPMHHPQYFEAHGTGTLAGDPAEAEAISSAFFPHGQGADNSPIRHPLYVGSIKTVIGHTEGTAGLAGLLKASLALQNAMIPPNLLFNRLNPRIEPFYDNLRVPTSLMPWPAVARGSPRRVSVNSFGFGGTNAHAILESYTPLARHLQPAQPIPTAFTPFVFSAASEASLRSYLAEFCDYLRRNKSTQGLRDIAYSLDVRRTRLPVGTAVGAPTADELCTKLEEKLNASRADPEQCVGVRVMSQTTDAAKPRVLGIFTGQGAQWAQMGLDLVTTSAALRRSMQNLQNRLDQLANADRPTWSLLGELKKDASSSRIMESAFSQPLCTAVQIFQVDLVRAAGIEFAAVVGHSSGEIAAAYAAGLISAEDAICIAYYRGLYSGLSQGSVSKRGAMMAVGTSAEDAHDLLSFPEFEGRACVAAVNSTTSVTLSGDEDAIEELKIIFDDEQKFARILKLDTAYHSHHMNACSTKYLNSLAALDIQIGPGSETLWFSSVYGSEMDKHDLLKGPYWDSNMVNPVHFMQALDGACAAVELFDLAIELGPHPALKGPALQTIHGRIPHTVPYTGLFQRGIPAITSFADALGYAWTHLGKRAVNLQSYDRFVSGNSSPRLFKGLPTYAWDHENEYWHESRYTRAMRMRPGPVHELLGHLTPDSTEQDMRWRHILRLSEIPWLKHHRLQNIAVFPATGYIVSVLEAALIMYRKAPVRLIEVLDIYIPSALVFEYDDLSIEIILSLTNISKRGEETIEAEFKFHAASGKDTDPLELKSSGRLRLHLGQPYHTVLPPRQPRRSNLVPVREGTFYESILELEYGYAGQFKALERIERKLGAATGFISLVEPSNLLIHPAQSIFLTYAAPGDGAQKSMHIPRRIRRLAVNPAFPHANLVCDIDIYPDDLDHAMIQVQGLECVPLAQQTTKDDREVFSNVVWDVADPDTQIIACDNSATVDQLELVALLHRVAGFYLRVLEREIPVDSPHRVEGPYKGLLEFASRTASLSRAGEVPFWQPQWEQDTPELLAEACEPFADTINMKVLSGFGNSMIPIVKGDESAMDVAMRASLMDEWPYCVRLRTVSSLPDLLGVDLSPNTVILSLADLDISVFKQLDNIKWEALKTIVLHAGTLVWVTQGRLADNPYANMMLGLVRGAARDNPVLDYLLLDIEDSRRIHHHIIAESLLRHKAASQWRQRDDIHLTVENELVLDKAGRFLISRLMMNEEMNDRYNSNQREIRRRVQPDLQTIAMSMSTLGWDIELEPPSRRRRDESIQLLTTHSLLSPVRVAEFGCMFVVLGKDIPSGDIMVALSSKNNSLIYPRKELSIRVRILSGSKAQLLWLTIHHLLASIVLRGLSKDDKVLVYEPSAEIASIIAEEATVLGVQVTFATTSIEASGIQDPGWVLIHPAISDRAIAHLAHEGFSVFVDMSSTTNVESIGYRISSALPVHSESTGLGQEHIPTVVIDSLHKRNHLAPLTVIEWATSSEISVKVRPVDHQVSFPNNKTYWLVGLTGGLGLSLCEWMVQRGARHFVITSRKPNIETAWLDELRAKGVVVKISACDVTQREQVVALHAEICSSMPAIAGVAQGAMVLQDIAIQNMTLEQLLQVTKPKVEGSIYLNELFQENTLDFFVFFSSASSVIGNNGQANYAAANTFMTSLAEQRRRRGLAASVIDIGPVFGVGYIARAAEGSIMGNVTAQAGAFVRTSERDFHQLFGEAVLAGFLGSTANIELVSGVRRVSQREERQPVWTSWPRMSHFILGHEGAEDQATTGPQGNIPVKERLAKTQSREQVYDIIWDAFARELGSHFQLGVSPVNKVELGAMRFDQMGIDSLTAVEIRAWFMRTLEINVPVLKILNGGSIGDLVTMATETIPPRLVPNLYGCSADEVGYPASAPSQGMLDSSDTDSSSPTDPGQKASSVSDFGSVQDSLVTTSSGTIVLKSVPVSFTQARFYPSGLFLEDKVGLNHTAWARITGKLDPERLRQAVRALGKQHEILRTAFFDQDGRQMQHILETSLLHLEHEPIENEDQILTKWLAFHYTNPHAKCRVKQFAEASEQRHADYAAGRFGAELRYWRKEFATPPAPLPLLTLARVDERPNLKAYQNVRAACRVGVDTKTQILKICRHLRATPFHFYLAALRALLLRYTVGGQDVTIAVAESGRGHDAEEMDVIGPLYNLVLVRLLSQPSAKFGDLLESVRDKTYAALANSKLPYPILVKELDLQRTARYYPFFQVFADYRMGQRERTTFGERNELHIMGFDLNVPYDVYLDTIDESDGECAHYFFLRNDIFSKSEAETLAWSYERLIRAFAAQPGIAVGDVDLSESGELGKESD